VKTYNPNFNRGWVADPPVSKTDGRAIAYSGLCMLSRAEN